MKNELMKTKIFLFVVFTFLCFLSNRSFAQAPDWLWAKSAGMGKPMEYLSPNSVVAVDASGNIYMAGYSISSSITFDSTTLTNVCGIFLAKYDVNGNVLWAKGPDGTGFCAATSIAVDALGNIYITGRFSGPTITFDSIILTNSSNHEDIFITKYDPSGNVLWAKSAGGNKVDQASSVAVDASGNVYIAGSFTSPIITFDSITLTNPQGGSFGSTDLFLTKYDPIGNVLWAKSADGKKSEVVTSIAVDALGNIFVAGGSNSQELIFGATTLTRNVKSITQDDLDFFLAKYDANGNVLWAKSAEGRGQDLATSVAIDSSGNAYIAGTFQSHTLLIGSTILTKTHILAGVINLFIAKYDPNGNVLWAKSAGDKSSDSNASASVFADTSGNAYLAGGFGGRTFSFDSINLKVSSGFGFDIFLVKYNTGGNVLWAKSAGDKYYEAATSGVVDASGNIYLTGIFTSNTLTFGSTTLKNTNFSKIHWNWNIFLVKLKP